MKAQFIAETEKESKMLAKSSDMASFLFELENNFYKRFLHAEEQLKVGRLNWKEVYRELVRMMHEDYNIFTEDLIE